MKLTVLVDNNTFIDKYYLAEPALSYLINDGNNTILFDVGYSDVFMINACRMNIDLSLIDQVVLSHGHNDHTGGIVHLKQLTQPLKLTAHPLVDQPKYYAKQDVGCMIKLKDLPNNFSLNLVTSLYQLTPNLIFLGEIPRIFDHEGFPLDGDPLLDDTAVIYHQNDVLWVITGCSHSGICNICEYAKKVSSINHITGIIGGFHLLDNPVQLAKTIDYFRQNPVDIIYPAHCSDLDSKIALAKITNVKEVGVGLEITI